MTQYHLVVLVHGLWGNTSHFDYIVDVLQEHADRHWCDEKNQLLVYTTTLNEGFRTYDGIDVCGFRVAEEIAHKIDSFEGSSRISKFSLVGYSLGGLIARYALGLLYKRGFFEKRGIQLINFTTFCTPHVGVLAPGKNFAVNVFNGVVPWLLGNSGRQIFLKDSVRNHGLKAKDEPLIYLMSHEDSVFFKGLQSFKNKTLYANVINDKRTAWWTAGISLNDPFFDINEFNGANVFRYIPGYETVIVDRDQPIVISKIQSPNNGDDEMVKSSGSDSNEDEQLQDFFFLNYWFAKLCRWIVVICNLCIIAPLILVWKIAQSSMEMTISAVRVTRFLNNYSTQLLQDFFAISNPVPLSPREDAIETPRNDFDDTDDVDAGDVSHRDNNLINIRPSLSGSSSLRSIQTQNPNNYNMLGESLNDQADHLMESIYDAIERKNIHAGFLQESPLGEGVSRSNDNSLVVSIRELEDQTIEQLNSRHGPDMGELIDNLHLDISPRQVDIIKSLNKIHWCKYPVYIRKTPCTHACAVVRQQEPLFDEGKIVVKHWIEKGFQIA
ncbi:hypothetical protein ZYGR_0S01380 [Zygosaccharomyces rouxii]|uniref:ZYRO0F05566p n=2 Tax=Zygosaccharomyces rouxii TaxID=4956 RepID=C5DXJ4_ZYGRC|nr:uncharacterized protein ZYRO0F05566g [Zygosaccharomyces rouxii]KAH9199267.1 putative serine esterase-domain-containing protein [Zygosaccharomyces rouxii]GAV50004.1 hypothetical protein ZYGR_0S01380 [Zygosaccharomyces rouxii]CAR28505.1 ZYRO0F05566p [Zygosaccharomyces rouxii]